MSISSRSQLQRLARERGSWAKAARALLVSASTARRWLKNGVPDERRARLAAKTKKYYPKSSPKQPKQPRSKRSQKVVEYKQPKLRKPAEYKQPSRRRPVAPVEAVLGFEYGPAFVEERKKLRVALQREPTIEETERMVEQRPQKKREILSFHDVMERVIERGVLDYAKFQRIAQRFHVLPHDVYNIFFGYPPSVGKVA